MNHLKFFKISLLVIIPALVFLAAVSVKKNAGPYWLGTNLDPSYAYLLNSLNLTQSKKLAYTDHPGTTLEVFGAGVIVIVHRFQESGNLVNDVLRDPELYLNAISDLIVFLLVISTFAVGLFTLYLTESLLFALIIQATPFLSTTPLYYLGSVTPEPLLLLGGLWFSFLILYIYYHRQENARLPLIFLSLISGFLVATKINSAPLLVIPFVFLRWKNKAFYFLATMASFIFFTLPMSHRYKVFYQWIYNLFTHAGKYGQGENTVLNWPVFLSNLKTIFFSEQFLTTTVIILITFLVIAFIKKKKFAWNKFLFGLILFYVIDISLVAKHFDTHYLIPAFAILGVSWVLLFSISKPNKTIKFGISALILAFAIYNFNIFVRATREASLYYQEVIRFDDFVNKNYKEATKVSYYSFSSVENALDFGNVFAGNAYGKQLSKIYTNQHFYNLLTRKYSVWGEETSLPSQGTIIFQGPRFEGSYLKYKPPLNLIDVFHGTRATVYLVKD